MAGRIIDGKAVAEEIHRQTAERVERLVARTSRRPRLVALQVGGSPSSKLYTDMQARAAADVGIEYELRSLSENAGEDKILGALAAINADRTTTGLILQMPLPAGVNARAMQREISAAKDVEGVHPENLGKLFYGASAVAPCTPLAVVELLGRNVDNLAGREVVVIGHSEIVGKPVAMLLLQSPTASPTVRICHVATRDLQAHVRAAEVLIVAAGVSQARWLKYRGQLQTGEPASPPDLSPLVPADWIQPGAVVIDVATNRIPKGFDETGQPLKKANGTPAMQTVGDVEFDAALEKVSAITPVPGGVGPVTVAMLLRNTVACAETAE
jgi:methylenetetrahydrofolate dehydrogenase (NADP+)/methenyltetrahydrofolate cyclohydrolase